MMDFVAAAMVLMLPVLSVSLYQVKVKRNYAAHKRLQIGLSSVLAVVIACFEVEVRRHDWRPLAAASPYFQTSLFPFLTVHLTIAVSTTLLWILTIATALPGFGRGEARPGPASRWHRPLGRAAALGLYATALTGWTFSAMFFHTDPSLSLGRRFPDGETQENEVDHYTPEDNFFRGDFYSGNLF